MKASVCSFATDVLEGLSVSPKRLPSKYFYDDEGSKLFKKIMELPEYYLTNSEAEIFQTHADAILAAFHDCGSPFHLIELGAGDASKTQLLIKHFLNQHVEFDYNPVDISNFAVDELVSELKQKFPALNIKPIVGDFMASLDRLAGWDKFPRIVLFLGSTIGNFSHDEAVAFCGEIRNHLNRTDRLLLGFDLKKDPAIIKRAYNDSDGITAAFNYNLLKRINRELEADFDLDNFVHEPAYNPESGKAKSFLVSKIKQTVFIKALAKSFDFYAWETIHTEISEKYNQTKINEIAVAAGFDITDQWADPRQYFMNSLWQPREKL
ncbi:MAG: L-histidine N(alpha)-methyltransferase [Methylococcaceae bacterium]